MQLENELKDIVVIYHAHCQDGFGSAYAAYQKFGDSASYIGASDRINPPLGLVNKEIYIVDYSYPKETLLFLEKVNKKLVVIDHHISVEEAVRSLKEYVFSQEHSGSYLAWEYFVGTEIPLFVTLLEIIDLKKDSSHEYREVITYILSKPLTFDSYTELHSEFEDTSKLQKIKEIGKAQNDYLELIIAMVTSNPDIVEFEGYTVPCVNFSLPINERTIALQELYEKYPPFAMSYRIDGGMIKVALRGNGDIDLAAIAVKYGGGGHRNSAGFGVQANCQLPFARSISSH